MSVSLVEALGVLRVSVSLVKALGVTSDDRKSCRCSRSASGVGKMIHKAINFVDCFFSVQNKADEFLQITAKTLESYFATYSDEESQEKSDEFQFVLAMCGTVTNIAASSCGRDVLVSHESGRALIDTFVSALSESGTGKNIKLRSLILMALYNTR